MKTKTLLYSLFISTTLLTNQCQSYNDFDNCNQNINYSQDINEIDNDTLEMIKIELENTKNILIEIRNNQNAKLYKKAVSGLTNLLSKLGYLTASTTICIAPLLGIEIWIGNDVFSGLFNNKFGAGLALFSVPAMVISITITYALLRKIFENDSQNQTFINIKEHLLVIDKLINKLNFEIKKIDRILNKVNTQKAIN